MASIYGVSIKSLKTFRGHEGEPLYQGDVYIDKEKQGFWSQDAHGAIEDNYDFNTWALNVLASDFKRDHLDEMDDLTARFFDCDALLLEVTTLMDKEKMFNKAVKAGNAGIIVVSNTYEMRSLPVSDDVLLNRDYLENLIDNFVKETAKKLPAWESKDLLTVDVYSSKRDFNLGRGMEWHRAIYVNKDGEFTKEDREDLER